MTLRPVYGHETTLRRLGAALASGRFPQASLLSGPEGSGKQRLALWIAQGYLCDGGPAAPCGECASCIKVLKLGHPDLHWFVPIARPKAGDASKQIESAKTLLGEAVEERRRNGLWTREEGMVSHPLASIRLLQRVASVTPYSGRVKVIIVGNAERLVVQEASQEAANALLKVLEEPSSKTVVMLTTSEPHSLLPTIRSRLVPIRVGTVTDDAVRAFLEREIDPPLQGARLTERAVAAAGCIGRALSASDAEATQSVRAERFLEAVRSNESTWDLGALKQAPWAARGDYTAMLEALSLKLRDGLVAHVDDGAKAGRWLDALRLVEDARDEAQGNANPQLGLAVLAQELEGLAL